MLTMRSLACTTALLVLVLLPLTQSTSQCAQACIALYAPVCGTDGVTYSNSCFLGIAACENPQLNLRIAHQGKCRKF
nr:turripeptide Lol9.1-like [Cherax quadricarinatus]